MSKKPSTVNLETSIWKDIETFMEKNEVNRNTAIEWMLIERRILLSKNNNDSEVVTKYEEEIETFVKADSSNNDNDAIGSSVIDDIYSSMPE